MSTQLVTVTPETLLIDANNLMEENRLWILPVVEDEKLIGYLEKEEVRAALPSPATLLSRYELNTIISKVTVADFIKKDIITVSPETEIEVAAELMVEHELSGLAVVNKSGKLVGLMSRKIMLDILVEAMGLHGKGKRFAIQFKDRPGVMAEVATLISDMGYNFVSAASFFHKDSVILVFRVSADDLLPILEALKQRDYNILTPDFFNEEWN
jgi:acetoin utilization protein AcuB